MFAPPLGERNCRFTLEVNDYKVLAGIEKLAKMQIAVGAHANGSDAAFPESLEASNDAGFICGNSFGDLKNILRQCAQTAKQLTLHSAMQIAHRLVDRALGEGRIRFRREGRISRIRRQR